MRVLNDTKIFFAVLLFCSLSGCVKSPPPPERTRRAADEKFLKLCQEEYKLNVVVKPLLKTVWVYLPLSEALFDYKANEKKDEQKKAPAGRALKFLDGKFANRAFQIEYAITNEIKYPQPPDPGYKSFYTEKFQAGQRNILSAISQAYGSLEKVPGDVDFVDPARDQIRDQLVKSYIPTGKAPDFFVMVIADTTRGIESRTTLYFPDLMRGTTDFSFYEEYSRRLVSEELKGNPAIVGDMTGEHLEAAEVAWGDFLTKQLLGRIRFKYQQSDFPPTDEDANEILNVIHATVVAYHFTDFDKVELRDLGAGKTYDFRREQLETFSQ